MCSDQVSDERSARTRTLCAAIFPGVDPGGLEPPTPALSRRCSNQLSYESVARKGGAGRDRTDDILLAKQALYQLSYGPLRGQVGGQGSVE